MSFISILRGALGVEQKIGPEVSQLYPPSAPWIKAIDPLIQVLLGSMISTEIRTPVDGQGPAKSAAVNADLNTYIENMNEGLAFDGKMIDDDKALRQAAIDAGVASLNASAAWKASFKVVPKA